MYAPAPFDPGLLRALAERQGVSPDDEDLEAVRGFLDAILPALAALDEAIPADTVPGS